MYMSDWEIQKEYRWAKDKAIQIGILADENVMKPKEMYFYMADLGMDLPPLKTVLDKYGRFRRDFPDDAFLSLYRAGLNDKEAADILGTSARTVRSARARLHLPANSKGGRPLGSKNIR